MLRATARPSPWLLLAAGYVLLLAAWTVSTHPFDAPDETSHYLRAYGLSEGHLLGPRERYTVALQPLQSAWVQHDTRGVEVPATYSPPNVSCVDGTPNRGRCLEASSTGNYEPFAFLLPALAIHASSELSDALWIARAASALLAGAFLLLAGALLWDGTLVSVLGLLLALTPMTLFVGSVLNPNGLELAASLALTAAVLRLSREPLHVPRWVWAGLTASAVATLLSWQLGPVYVALNFALLFSLLGRSGCAALLRKERARAAAGLGTTALAAILFFAYAAHAGAIHSSFQISPVRHSIQTGIDQLASMLQQSIGNFGSVNVPLDHSIYYLWSGLLAALVIWGLMLSGGRMRALIALAALTAVVFPVLFYGFIYRYTGFGLQGRYVLPVLFLLPLLSGEAIRRAASAARATRATRVAAAAVLLLVATLQLAAWWRNAQVNAGLPKAPLASPLDGARWLPPGGWLLWTILAALGAGSLALAAATDARRSFRSAA